MARRRDAAGRGAVVIVHEAATTFTTLIDALIGWITFLAVTASILALAAIACGAWAVDLAWGWLYARARPARDAAETPEPEQPPRAPERRTRRRVPSWAHTQPLDYEEAA